MPLPSSVTAISAAAAALGHDVDACRAGIERILDQFLDDARRPLDHFAGGDAVDDAGFELADGHGISHSIDELYRSCRPSERARPPCPLFRLS